MTDVTERKNPETGQPGPAGQWPPGEGEMACRIREFDWSKTPLGAPQAWPESLKAAVTFCLGSRMPIVVWWDREQAIQFYNDAYISFLGPTKHPVFLGRSGRECWQEIWDTIGPLWDTVFGAGEATWSEDILLAIDRTLPQEEGYFTFSYSPIRGTTGTVDGLFCACYETTGKVVGARRLETLRRLGEQAMEANSIADACARAAAVLRENAYDITFAHIYLLDSNSGLPADAIAPEALGSALQTRRPAEVNGLELSGGVWPEATRQAVALPLFLATHEAMAGLMVLGVSPRRPLDAEYRAFFDLIAGHVSTAMANARAREEEHQRAEALAEIDRAKTAFFSNVSHEFRTPLTLMLGPVEELLARSHTDLPPAAKGQLEVVNRNGLRLLRLVNTLLDFSRIEAGRVQAVYEPTDLAAFTAELASAFRAATERAGLNLIVDCPRLPEPVYVDRDMWEKIVLNLISNAFKFTFEGEIEIKLRAESGRAVLTVRDTGVGVPAEEMPRLFERFHRVPNTRSRTYEGSGIGLALVQELVKLNGGSIRAESRFGAGTAFIVAVPLGTGHLAPDRLCGSRTLTSPAVGAAPFVEEALRWLPEAAQSEEPFEPAPLRELMAIPCPPDEVEAGADRPRILIADDNADMRHYLARLLMERYTVEAVPDGRAALVAAHERLPDLVLSDVMMPNLDGFGLVRELRADTALKTVPVILLSARAGEESRVEGMQQGADDYLIKPFSARELMARVAAHLDMARLRREADEQVRRSEERFRKVFEHAAFGMVIGDMEGRVLESNPAIERMLGYSKEELRYRQFSEFTYPDDLTAERPQIEQVIAGHSDHYQIEKRYLRKDGQIIWVRLIGSMTRDSSGNPLIGIALIEDITERKQAEEALQERTAQLEEANRELESFSYTVSHDLKAPLRAIGGFSRMILKKEETRFDEETRRRFQVIMENCEKMGRMIDDLLAFSRLCQQEVTKGNLDMAALVQDVWQEFVAIHPDRAMTLKVEPMPAAFGDQTLVRQVYANLLGNAVKFMKTRETALIEAGSIVKDNETVYYVKDNGIGFDMKFYDKLFGVFQRLHSDAEYEGTGIGLASIQRIINRHGGRVWAEGEVDKGATFYFTLPTSQE